MVWYHASTRTVYTSLKAAPKGSLGFSSLTGILRYCDKHIKGPNGRTKAKKEDRYPKYIEL